MDTRLPANTPIVSLSAMVVKPNVVLLEGSLFADNRTRIVAPEDSSPETVATLASTLLEVENMAGRRRWLDDMISGFNPNRAIGGQDA